MRKELTTKDVLYALEYLGDALERISIKDGKAKWQMRSGAVVKDRIAHEVTGHPGVSITNDLSRQIVMWKQAA